MQATVYWVEGPWPGRLAIVARPRGGDWLEDEVSGWRAAGLNLIVSTLQPEEVNTFDLAAEPALCQAQQVQFIPFGIEDRQVPASQRDTAGLARGLAGKLAESKNVAVHCRQSIGRSGLVAACVLVLGGVDVLAAFERLSKARGCTVPETAEQRAWVERFAQAVAAKLLD
jgi:protein-tyrosine phosphatase